MAIETMTSEGRELARRVSGLTAGLVLLIAAVAWTLAGLVEAVGALVGGALTAANFLGLHWAAAVALRRGGAGGRVRTALWLVGAGGRLGAVAVTLGWAVAVGWIGIGGLLAALLALPVSLVAEGLRAARVA